LLLKKVATNGDAFSLKLITFKKIVVTTAGEGNNVKIIAQNPSFVYLSHFVSIEN